MYAILEDKRGGLSCCPQNWIKQSEDGQETRYWPKNYQNELVNDPYSEPILSGEDKWLIVKDKIKRRNLLSKLDAEKEMERMDNKTETEEEENDVINERSKRLQTKGAAKLPCTIPTFKVSATPPNSALRNATISSSPKTPTNTQFNNAPFTNAQAFTPSSILTDEIVSIDSAFIGNRINIQEELDSIANVSIANDVS